VWHNRNVVFGQELLNCHSHVTGRVIVMQRPVVLSFLRPFPPSTFSQTSQNFHVEISSNTCPRRYEFPVHCFFIIEKWHQRDLDDGLCCFLGRWDELVCISDDCFFISGSYAYIQLSSRHHFTQKAWLLR
jgi:hypothetical protein